MSDMVLGVPAADKPKAHAVSDDRAPANGDVRTVVKPVANAVAILRFLGEAQSPATATQIARKLQINTSTCFNILRTLAGEGMIDFDPTDKTYRIGYGLVKFVRSMLSDSEPFLAASNYLHELAETFRVTATIWRRVGLQRMILVAAEHSSADLRIQLRIGMRLPILLGSTGRAIATRLGRSKSDLSADFKKLVWARPLGFEEYWAEAELAAERGFAVDDGAFAAGVQTISAPILNGEGRLSHYSVTVLTFQGRHDPAEIERIGQAVARTARDLGPVLA